MTVESEVSSRGIVPHMEERGGYVYIVTNARNGTLYVGVTSDLRRRVWEHKTKVFSGFTSQYGLGRLVWFERHEEIVEAIRREKRIKQWNRAWKLQLIEAENSGWADLYERLGG
jgi:putative endonuclease